MATILGVPEFEAALEAITLKAAEGAKLGVAEGAAAAVEAIQVNIEGPPRWLRGQNFPRGGGPGILTGALREGIHKRRVKIEGPGAYSTEVRANRIYAARTEQRYPYFAKGVDATPPVFAEKFERNIATALEL